jgi:hypothetical protein
MSKVVIAGFRDEESALDFIRRITDATVESLLYLSTLRKKMPAIPIVQVRRIAIANRRLYSEHKQYSSLFYVNEAAIGMCKDLDISISIVGESAGMTEEAGFELEAYYMPFAQREKANPGRAQESTEIETIK